MEVHYCASCTGKSKDLKGKSPSLPIVYRKTIHTDGMPTVEKSSIYSFTTFFKNPLVFTLLKAEKFKNFKNKEKSNLLLLRENSFNYCWTFMIECV